jgi:hypothetical protein
MAVARRPGNRSQREHEKRRPLAVRIDHRRPEHYSAFAALRFQNLFSSHDSPWPTPVAGPNRALAGSLPYQWDFVKPFFLQIFRAPPRETTRQ